MTSTTGANKELREALQRAIHRQQRLLFIITTASYIVFAAVVQRRLEELDGTHQIPFDELFDPEFMIEFTDFTSIDEMLETSGFKTDTEEDFAAIPDAEWDQFVARTTRFANWHEMQQEAGNRWAQKKLEGE
jgi:hypothetical protein